MKITRCYVFFALFAGYAINCNLGAVNPEKQQVNISFKPSKGAHHYEVQWLRQNPPEATPLAEPFYKSPLVKIVSTEIRFFRLRSVSAAGVAGPWSHLYRLALPAGEQFVFLPKNSKKQASYLVKKELDLRQIVPADDLEYSLNRGPRIVYEAPLPLEKDGHYHLQVFEAKSAAMLKELEFRVDRSAPASQARFYPVFYVENNLCWLGPDASIVLEGKDNTSDIENIYFRLYPANELAPEFQLYHKALPSSSAGNQEGYFWLEFYSEDAAGNQENVQKIKLAIDTRPPRISILSKNRQIARLKASDSSLPLHVTTPEQSRYTGSGNIELDLQKKSAGDTITVIVSDRLKNRISLEIVVPEP